MKLLISLSDTNLAQYEGRVAELEQRLTEAKSLGRLAAVKDAKRRLAEAKRQLTAYKRRGRDRSSVEKVSKAPMFKERVKRGMSDRLRLR